MWRDVIGSSGPCSRWGHCWDGGVVPVAFVGGESVECGYDDVLCLPFQGYVSLCAKILGWMGCRVEGYVGYGSVVCLFAAVGGVGPPVSWDVVMVVLRGGGGASARDSTMCRGMACFLYLFGRM